MRESNRRKAEIAKVEELEKRAAQEQIEKGNILCEIGELVTDNVTVGEAFEQWVNTDPEKYHKLAVLIARLALV